MLYLVHPEPAHIAGPTSGIVPQCEDGGSTPIITLDQLLENVALVRREFSWSEQLLCGKRDSTRRVAGDLFFIDEPICKAAQYGFDALPMADTGVGEHAEQVGPDSRPRQISARIKGCPMSWLQLEKGAKLPQNNGVGGPGRFAFQGEPTDHITINPEHGLARCLNPICV